MPDFVSSTEFFCQLLLSFVCYFDVFPNLLIIQSFQIIPKESIIIGINIKSLSFSNREKVVGFWLVEGQACLPSCLNRGQWRP